MYLNTFRKKFVKIEKEEKGDNGDKEEGELEGTPDGLLTETDLVAAVLPVLAPLVDREDGVEDGGDETDNHHGVVLLARSRALAEGAKKTRNIKNKFWELRVTNF